MLPVNPQQPRLSEMHLRSTLIRIGRPYAAARAAAERRAAGGDCADRLIFGWLCKYPQLAEKDYVFAIKSNSKS